jgi:hypothetical protein
MQEQQEEQTTNELHENIWAVISERGCEGIDLTYDEAAALMRKLSSINIFGLCVVTSKAARCEINLQNETL